MFFASEEECWSGSESTSLPFPMGREAWAFPSPGGVDTFAAKDSFVTFPEQLPLLPLTPLATQLVRLLDHPQDASVLSNVNGIRDVYEDLKELEAATQCKDGRGDSTLYLWSSAGTKPPSRDAFNPVSDLNVGDLVILKVENCIVLYYNALASSNGTKKAC